MLTSVLLALLACAAAVAAVAAGGRRRLARELQGLRSASRIDQETALGNERAFADDLHRELLRADRTGRPATVVVFGLAPDWSGEGSGRVAEKRVIEIARTIAGTIRSVDVAYRIGTAELAVILPETRAEAAMNAVGRIEQRIPAGESAPLRAGVAEAGPGIDRHEVFRHAYAALLAAGKSGRDRALIYSPEYEQPGWTGSHRNGELTGPPVDFVE
jgi:diguanylate cyclase (GGDEF)-like protein